MAKPGSRLDPPRPPQRSASKAEARDHQGPGRGLGDGGHRDQGGHAVELALDNVMEGIADLADLAMLRDLEDDIERIAGDPAGSRIEELLAEPGGA
jgi:hypothetical protein